MTVDPNKIPVGELFADLQQSMTNLFLMETLASSEVAFQYQERYIEETKICNNIKAIMKSRFSTDDLINYLKNGYPRRIEVMERS